jgi:hypothetical protein
MKTRAPSRLAGPCRDTDIDRPYRQRIRRLRPDKSEHVRRGSCARMSAVSFPRRFTLAHRMIEQRAGEIAVSPIAKFRGRSMRDVLVISAEPRIENPATEADRAWFSGYRIPVDRISMTVRSGQERAWSKLGLRIAEWVFCI